MASLSHRSGSKSARNEAPKVEEEAENNGYIQVFMKPLEKGNYNLILEWLGLSNVKLSAQQLGWAYGIGLVSATVFVYQLILSDLGYMFHRLCALLVPIFSIVCSFYWLAL